VISPSEQNEPQAGHPRSEARAHLCKLCLRAVRASPRHPIALPQLETIRQSAGIGVAVAAAATSTVGSGAGAAPAARRPARGPRAAGVGTETAARSAPRTPFRYYPSTPLKKIAPRANLGPLLADFPSPPAPPLSRPVSDLATVPIAGIPPSGRLRPRGRGKPLPCLCAVLWDRELSLWGACVLLWLGGGLVGVIRSAPLPSDCGLPPARGANI